MCRKQEAISLSIIVRGATLAPRFSDTCTLAVVNSVPYTDQQFRVHTRITDFLKYIYRAGLKWILLQTSPSLCKASYFWTDGIRAKTDEFCGVSLLSHFLCSKNRGSVV